MTDFKPTLQAARARLSAVNPDAYARSRNVLNGAVTRLSPYVTHGILSLRDVYAAVHAKHPLEPKHKLVFELGWRAYYRHVWSHLGDGIEQSLHPGLLPDDAYKAEMPADVLEARSGIAAIDLAIQDLYDTGYVHNHARMWLASYLVHLRKVHWRTGAQWMLSHLLDGDLASNHLSWQWVAATGSSKPYLFNADNVAKYAPAHWLSPGTGIDTSYEALDRFARSAEPINTRFDARHAGAGRAQPHVFCAPPQLEKPLHQEAKGTWLNLQNQNAGDAHDSDVQGCDVQGRDVWLHLPWTIVASEELAPPDALHIALGFVAWHAAKPWSARRWAFVTEGLALQTHRLWWGDLTRIAYALKGAKSVHWCPDPHANDELNLLQTLLQSASPQTDVGPRAVPCLFEPVERYCHSFSDWWKRTAVVNS